MTTQKQAPLYIRNMMPFVASSLSGYPINNVGMRGWDPARMDNAEWLTYRCYLNANAVDYVVVSYETPIAYHTTSDGWVVCKKKHSVTTSKHQSIVRRAISNA